MAVSARKSNAEAAEEALLKRGDNDVSTRIEPANKEGHEMKTAGLAALIGLSLIAGSVLAQEYALEFGNEVKQGEQRAGFTNKVMVKSPTFTVGAVAVKDEIKPHRHNDGSHVLYIVSGSGTMMHGDKTITLKPGMVVYVPVGVPHGVKSNGDLTFVDFAQPPFDPNKMEWIK
jgi:mannose-6-phosphate isomerase-like protein (cupin superfamily)